MTKILNFGSLNIDLVYRVPHFVRPGETLDSLGREVHAGGKGANQSMALARAGARVWHAGRVGRDGAWLVAKLAAAGVDVSYVRVGDEPTGHAVIQVDDAGQNAIVLHGGANRAIAPEGSMLAEPGAVPVRVPAQRVKVTDTTAAGDTFIGYFLAGVAAGDEQAGSMRLATAAAALCVGRAGAMDSIPSRNEVLGECVQMCIGVHVDGVCNLRRLRQE